MIATGFGKVDAKKVDKPMIPAMKRFAQLPGFKDRSKEIPPFSISVREGNRETPAFMRRVKASERFDELKLDPPSDFTIEDEDRFDIPTFLRKQAD